jgi:hypothetical protein
MNDNPEHIGEQLGIESVEQAIRNLETYCKFAQQAIILRNKPEISALQAEGCLLREEEKDLFMRLRLAPPDGDLRIRRARAFYSLAVTVLLTAGGFFFALLAFEPYRLGWKARLYCIGISVVTPFLVDEVLDKWNAKSLLKWTATVACASALSGLMLLAIVRGKLVAQQLQAMSASIIFDDAQPSQAQPVNDFYQSTVLMLQILMLLLSLAMELGAGLALHEAWRMFAPDSEDWRKLRTRLGEIRDRLKALVFRIETLESEAALFAATLYREFYRAMLTRALRSAITRFSIFLVCIVPFLSIHAAAQNKHNVVIALDLTQSEVIKGPDGQSEFQQNVDAVTRQLAVVRADSRVTIIGITDASFAQPYILVSAQVSPDAGYFGERVNSARREMMSMWKQRSRNLQPQFPDTDIIGALFLASEIFKQTPGSQNTLVIFSDMRNSASGLDLETPSIVPSYSAVPKKDHILAELKNVQVYTLGVDGAGKSLVYWQTLRDFWAEYFRMSGANMRVYSALRMK